LFLGANAQSLGGWPDVDTQLAMTSSGEVLFGASTRLSRPRVRPHQGQLGRGNGDGAVFEALFL
jgi:hypothetical protein